MRVIKFRGFDGKRFYYGDLINYGKYKSIRYDINEGTNKTPHYVEVIVHPETVGQFTGLLDKNGVEIYKGDKCDWDGKKVLISWCNQSASFVMTWKKVVEYDWEFKTNNYRNPLFATYGDDDGKYIHEYLEVIGNIHELTT